jgi:hypothetical protein
LANKFQFSAFSKVVHASDRQQHAVTENMSGLGPESNHVFDYSRNFFISRKIPQRDPARAPQLLAETLLRPKHRFAGA